MSEDNKDCYDLCNKRFGVTNPGRTYCKKGCDSEDEGLEKCKKDTCTSMCVKGELGDDSKKLGGREHSLRME